MGLDIKTLATAKKIISGTNESLTDSSIISALGYTPINSNKIGSADGIASLDSSGKVPSEQLPNTNANALRFKGVTTFVDIPDLEDVEVGDMYMISDGFTTNNDEIFNYSDYYFQYGVTIRAGANVYKDSNGKWSFLGGNSYAASDSPGGAASELCIFPKIIPGNNQDLYRSHGFQAYNANYIDDKSTSFIGNNMYNNITYDYNHTSFIRQIAEGGFGYEIAGINEGEESGRLYVRSLSNNKWNDWNRVITNADLYGENLMLGEYDVYADNHSIALGKDATAMNYAIAIGYETYACDPMWENDTMGSTAIGAYAEASNDMAMALGYESKAYSPYSTALGYGATVESDSFETIQLGNNGVSALRCKVALSVTSDERDKTDFKPIEKALDFIRLLEPVSFVSNERMNYAKENLTKEEKENYKKYGFKPYDKEEHAKGTKKGERRRVGLKAQDTIKALKKVYGSADVANIVNDNFHDITEEVPEGIENKYTMTYESLIPYLISGMQELNDKVNKLEDRLSVYENQTNGDIF